MERGGACGLLVLRVTTFDFNFVLRPMSFIVEAKTAPSQQLDSQHNRITASKITPPGDLPRRSSFQQMRQSRVGFLNNNF
jgi:hypothetical protein